MQPKLDVWLDEQTDPQTVPIHSLGFWVYDELAERAHSPSSEHGLRLTLAYIEIVEKEPETLAEVKAWAREHKVTVTMAEAPDPTPSGHTGETS